MDKLIVDESVEIQVARDRSPNLSAVEEIATPQKASAGSNIAAQIAPTAGDVVDERFLLLERLSSERMPLLFLASDQQTPNNPEVTLKMWDGSTSFNRATQEQFEHEAAESEWLDRCPNIRCTVNYGDSGRFIYRATRKTPSLSLQEYLKSLAPVNGRPGKPRHRKSAEAIVRGIANALSYAHANHRVHADLRPECIDLLHDAITSSSEVQVTNFGIVPLRRPEESTNAQRAIADIKPTTANRRLIEFELERRLETLVSNYASVQMLELKPADLRDDVYSLACITYELYTGQHPFEPAKVTQARDDDLQVPSNPALTNDQLDAIRQAMSFTRSERTESVELFVAAFYNNTTPVATSRLRNYAIGSLSAFVLAALGFAALQIMDTVPASSFSECAECPTMVSIAAGSFTQGSDTSLANESPSHRVNFTSSFALSSTEITVNQFQTFANETNLELYGCTHYQDGVWQYSSQVNRLQPGFEQSSSHPVTCVSYEDAIAYTRWLSIQANAVYRLPSAAEWEFAATFAPSESPGSTHQTGRCENANIADQTAGAAYPGWEVLACSDGQLTTAPVASYEATPSGLYDALGNVFEWVDGCWQPDYSNATTDGAAVLTGECNQAEVRGGSWYTRPDLVRESLRNRQSITTRSTSIGFRVLREAPLPRE